MPNHKIGSRDSISFAFCLSWNTTKIAPRITAIELIALRSVIIVDRSRGV